MLSLDAGFSALPQAADIAVAVPEDLKFVMTESLDDFKHAMEALLAPIRKVCLKKLSQTRCAAHISREDLRNVRKAFKTVLQDKDTEDDAFANQEVLGNVRFEVEQAADHLRTIKSWAPGGSAGVRRGLEFRNARGHVLREAGTPLQFPISGSNDVILTLHQYAREPELGAFMGVEIQRGLTAQGLRQAEVEYYLWAACSYFPFVQIITDMQAGGAAFYSIGSSLEGNHIVVQILHGMDSVRDFVKSVLASIPDDAGENGSHGMMNIPCSLENPTRMRHREDAPGPEKGAGGGSVQGEPMSGFQRGYQLIAAMQPDVGNELLVDLDDFDVNL